MSADKGLFTTILSAMAALLEKCFVDSPSTGLNFNAAFEGYLRLYIALMVRWNNGLSFTCKSIQLGLLSVTGCLTLE